MIDDYDNEIPISMHSGGVITGFLVLRASLTVRCFTIEAFSGSNRP